jgi:hypothetical protein
MGKQNMRGAFDHRRRVFHTISGRGLTRYKARLRKLFRDQEGKWLPRYRKQGIFFGRDRVAGSGKKPIST